MTPIKLYKPSSGTEGEAFISHWCANCKRDSVCNGSVQYDEAGDDDYCQIIAATMSLDVSDPIYPKEWHYDTDGAPVCSAFVSVDRTESSSFAERDDYTADLFEVRP